MYIMHNEKIVYTNHCITQKGFGNATHSSVYNMTEMIMCLIK